MRRLDRLGVHDEDAFGICLSAGATAGEMQALEDLKTMGLTPVPDTYEGSTAADRWNAVFALVSEYGLDAVQIAALRGHGLSDWAVLSAIEAVGDVETVTRLARAGHRHMVEDAVRWVAAFERDEVPVREAPLWADAGFTEAGRNPSQWMPVIVLWRVRVGERAAECAAAGLTLREAVSGAWSAEAIDVLRGLRQAG